MKDAYARYLKMKPPGESTLGNTESLVGHTTLPWTFQFPFSSLVESF
jgi:hypothetical protein